jgi:hypothetical protein
MSSFFRLNSTIRAIFKFENAISTKIKNWFIGATAIKAIHESQPFGFTRAAETVGFIDHYLIDRNIFFLGACFTIKLNLLFRVENFFDQKSYLSEILLI